MNPTKLETSTYRENELLAMLFEKNQIIDKLYKELQSLKNSLKESKEQLNETDR